MEKLTTQGMGGDVSAQARLCSIYMNEGHATDDYSNAGRWCSLAANNGDAEAQSLYARLFQMGAGVPKDDQKAAEWYEKAAQKQNPYALFMLGNMLIAKATPADTARGISLLQRSAALGNPRARWVLEKMAWPPEEYREQPLLTQPER